MKDIVKEIREVESGENFKNRELYFTKETTLSRKYFNSEVISKYPNLEFIRIYMKKTNFIPTFHESIKEEEYYLYSVFIEKNLLDYISSDNLISNLNGELVIDLSQYRWNEQLKLRNKILKSCPILMSEYSYYCDSSEFFCSNVNMNLSSNISIYPCKLIIDDYNILNSTNFILISNSSLISQDVLDNLCMEILDKLSNENQNVINCEKAIYISISQKLKRNRLLTADERMILDQFINDEMIKIDSRNTLLIMSRKKV